MTQAKKIIYDVGMHKGEDTKYYLARGFKVIAFEADPDLAKACRIKFKKQIDDGNLIIIEGAIIKNDNQETVTFYKNNKKSDWGTVVESRAQRNLFLGAASKTITVPVVNFAKILEKYGEPYYLKIDIEGMDLICLKKLLNLTYRPAYISIESNKLTLNLIKEEFEVLRKLGYQDFKIQQQQFIPSLEVPAHSKEGNYIDYSFEYGSTGLFGSDLPNQWLDYKQALREYKKIFQFHFHWFFGINSFLQRWPHGKYFVEITRRILRRPPIGWHDTHAKYSEGIKN